jgi:hypothetical protein
MRILLIRVEANATVTSSGALPGPEELEAALRDGHVVRLFDLGHDGGHDGLRRTISAFKPHVVGTVMAGDADEDCSSALALARWLDPGILTVAIAPGAARPAVRQGIDVLCLGDAASTFREIVGRFEAGDDLRAIHGIAVGDAVPTARATRH